MQAWDAEAGEWELEASLSYVSEHKREAENWSPVISRDTCFVLMAECGMCCVWSCGHSGQGSTSSPWLKTSLELRTVSISSS